ncbi:hypothetical protein ACMFMG_002126 [Clarireedia jacksonii]
MGSPTYQPLPRDSTDSERMPLNSPLYPIESSHAGRTCRLSINYVLILRIANFAMALPAFVLFIEDGYGNNFIAAEVFLMFGIVFNVLRILHSFISSVFHVDIEISCGAWRRTISVQPNGASATHVVDVLLAVSLMISMIVGVSHNHRTYRVLSSIGLSFTVMTLQYIIALPIRDSTFALVFKFHKERSSDAMLQYRDADDAVVAPAVAQTAENMV